MSFKAVDAEESRLIARFLQIPYKEHGCGFDGANCWTGIKLWYKERLGIDLWDLESYPKDFLKNSRNLFLENYYREWIKVEVPQPYDVVLFRFRNRLHGGWMMRQDMFMQIGKAGCSVQLLGDSDWKERLEGFFRYKGRCENSH